MKEKDRKKLNYYCKAGKNNNNIDVTQNKKQHKNMIYIKIVTKSDDDNVILKCN